ncbi:MAG: hypothetical protein UW62_C0029G0003 [Candidatus Collierbacteria bacterium GW2011_GWB1_44_35]|uniref:Uncharacterized protein n=1 Tax=Candidatus Collierbacteria bacterium GW2011_GWB1_44_35 TaxID=1618383 RepID=A0A0G1LF12_9BACT|nr:MAG: hypothetical protein UW62_C0029G0003 [Candidatus Collierbacteria bacterium GW2011_GWB1_44_35]
MTAIVATVDEQVLILEKVLSMLQANPESMDILVAGKTYTFSAGGYDYTLHKSDSRVLDIYLAVGRVFDLLMIWKAGEEPRVDALLVQIYNILEPLPDNQTEKAVKSFMQGLL